jgi:hypothetical protein
LCSESYVGTALLFYVRLCIAHHRENAIDQIFRKRSHRIPRREIAAKQVAGKSTHDKNFKRLLIRQANERSLTFAKGNHAKVKLLLFSLPTQLIFSISETLCCKK